MIKYKYKIGDLVIFKESDQTRSTRLFFKKDTDYENKKMIILSQDYNYYNDPIYICKITEDNLSYAVNERDLIPYQPVLKKFLKEKNKNV